MVGGGGQVTGGPRSGFKEGGKENCVEAGGNSMASTVEGKLASGREEAAVGISIGAVGHQGGQGWGGADMLAGGVLWRHYSVEISHQEGGIGLERMVGRKERKRSSLCWVKVAPEGACRWKNDRPPAVTSWAKPGR